MASALALAVLIASAAGSVGAIVAGRSDGAWRMLALDAAAFGMTVWVLVVLDLAAWSRDLGGVFAVLVVVARLAPAAWAVARAEARPWLALGVAFGAYGALAAWLPAASLPFGDQIHYLLAADALAHGRLEYVPDPAAFRQMLGSPLGPDDIATHVANTPLGPRPIQGYALPLVILPGWALAQRLGAGLILAFAGAWASWQMLLVLRDLLPARPRIAGATWLIASASAPLALLATHEYPNVLGAALVATAFRAGFTAPAPCRRPALAATVLALMLFLNPRDAVPLAVLLPALWLREPAARRRIAFAAVAVALLAAALGAVLYGVPLPYASYLFGTQQAQEVTQRSSVTLQLWVTLPAILFDRTFGLAGSAPWIFIGLAGLAPALRADRSRLLPAALAVGLSIAGLGFFRLWEGGYAPPARYFVDVLPLWAPFVAYGLIAATDAPRRALIALLVAMSAVGALVLSAMPSLALNGAFDDKIRVALGAVLGVDPLGWLPSFVATAPDWWTRAYPALIPALAGCALLLAPPLRRAWPALGTSAFLAANAALISWTAVAPLQPFTAGEGVLEGMLRRWLPLALALATIATAWTARALDPLERSRLLRRHFLLYLAPLVLMLVARFGEGVTNGQLAAVYLLVPAGFALSALFALWTAVERLADRRAALHLALVALVALAALLPYQRVITVMPTASDEPHYLIVTLSLLYERSFNTRSEYTGDRYEAFYPDRLPDVHAIQVGNALYSIRDPGLPILAVGPYALAGRAGVQALMALVAAALLAQLYLLLRDLDVPRRAALLAAASAGFAHPLFTYATQIYPELLTALVFVSAARAIRRGARASLGELAIVSALTGTLPWLSTRAWPVAVGLGLVVAWSALAPRWRGECAGEVARRALAGAAPFAALVLALAYLNWREFGLFMPSAGYYLISGNQQVLAYAPWIGGPGLLLDRVFGLIPRAPVYLIAFVGLVPLWRVRRAHGAELAALALGALLSLAYIADIAYWWADGSPPSRYLIASLPLFAAALGPGWAVVLGAPRAARTLAALALGASVAVAYVYAALPNIRIDLASEVARTGSAGGLFTFLANALAANLGLAFPSLVRIDAASAALVLAWTALALLLAALGARRESRLSR